MGCGVCNNCRTRRRNAPTKPLQGDLTNLEYLELLEDIKSKQDHAAQHHKKETWICWFKHHWHDVIDASYDIHRVCHRCGKYQNFSARYRD